jgi:methylglutaconyl-CoA hydratase
MRTLNGLTKPASPACRALPSAVGSGLWPVCDIAVAGRGATFSLSEVRLGLIPAVISPYVIGAIGERHARRYFLTAERFDSQEGPAYRPDTQRSK